MLTVVSGPPCSGKSRYVDEHSGPGDLGVSVDRLAVALGHPGDRIDWDTPHPAREAARAARRAVLDVVVSGQLYVHAWLIDTRPHPTSLRIWERMGADFITLDPGRDVCRQRALEADRPASTLEQIDQWYGLRSAAG